MRTYKMGRYETTILEMMQTAATVVKIQSMNLGGVSTVSGGGGGPPGGFIGYLPQSRVAYDSGEVANSGIPSSGYPSLYDNLNHIRFRIEQLEEGSTGGGVAIYENGVLVASGVTILDITGAEVTSEGGGEVSIVFSGGIGGGHTIQNASNFSMTQRSKLKFIGATLSDDSVNDRTIVTISGGGEVYNNYTGGSPTSNVYAYNLCR
jgi:hypothetical protein